MINLDYKVDKDSFKKIKQTELRIIKKIDVKKIQIGEQDEGEVYQNDVIIKDDQFTLTKNIVSLKNEKRDAKLKNEQDDPKKQKKQFDLNEIPFGYIFGETLVNKQNEKANDDMERQNKQKEDENRIEKQKYYFNKK